MGGGSPVEAGMGSETLEFKKDKEVPAQGLTELSPLTSAPQLMFEATRGSTTYLDIALDALSIKRGTCNHSEFAVLSVRGPGSLGVQDTCVSELYG